MYDNVLDWRSPDKVGISRRVSTPILCYLPVRAFFKKNFEGSTLDSPFCWLILITSAKQK